MPEDGQFIAELAGTCKFRMHIRRIPLVVVSVSLSVQTLSVLITLTAG